MRKAALISGGIVVLLGGAGAMLLRPKEDGKDVRPRAKVTAADLSVTVVDSGTVDAGRTVEVKGRVTGRVARLLVEEGDQVVQGQLLAIIDPQETRLRVEQDRAQLSGAQSSLERSGLELEQRRETNLAAIDQARARVAQLRLELGNQPRLTSAAIETARASLRTAQEERRRLIESSQPTQRAAAVSTLAEAKENVENAQAEYDRQLELEKQGYVAARSVQSAKLAIGVAQARLGSAQSAADRLDAQFAAEIAKAEAAIRAAAADLDRARAGRTQDATKREELKSAEAALATAEAGRLDAPIAGKTRAQNQASVSQLRSVLRDSERQLGETEIRAPMSGVVTKRAVQVGELATGLSQFSAGSTIVRIEDRSRFMVKLDINEIDVAKLKVGMTAEVRVEALPGKTLSGRVARIAPASRSTTVEGAAATGATEGVPKYEVEIAVSAAQSGMRSGMTAKCTILVTAQKGAASLPLEYVVRTGDAPYVEVADGPKKSRRVPVRLGVTSVTRVEILSGVHLGDEVLKPAFDGPARLGMQIGGDGG